MKGCISIVLTCYFKMRDDDLRATTAHDKVPTVDVEGLITSIRNVGVSPVY